MYGSTNRIIPMASEGDVTVRLARDSDAQGLLRLAAMDSAPVPIGPTLVAEVDFGLVAALPIEGSQAIADPFHRTAAIVQMLELRAGQMRASTAAGPGIGRRARGFARAVLAA